MRPARLLACTAAVAAFTLAPSATAAGKVCNLVVDAKGDQRMGGNHTPDGVYESPDQDIVGGDIASNKRYVTAVVRLASLRDVDTDVPTGRSYVAAFTVGATRYSMHAVYGVDSQSGSASNDTAGVGLGHVGVVWDFQSREVRMTAPVSYFGAKPGSRIGGLTLTSNYHFGSGGVSVGAVPGYGAYAGAFGTDSAGDTATTTRTYVAGTPSCVGVAR
jgi:hypothetical protein